MVRRKVKNIMNGTDNVGPNGCDETSHTDSSEITSQHFLKVMLESEVMMHAKIVHSRHQRSVRKSKQQELKGDGLERTLTSMVGFNLAVVTSQAMIPQMRPETAPTMQPILEAFFQVTQRAKKEMSFRSLSGNCTNQLGRRQIREGLP